MVCTEHYRTVSIIICTHNRATSLKQTLTAIGHVCVPNGMKAELVVVDNASTDGTAQLVQNTSLPNMPMRYVLEPRRGKGYAYNTGMAHAHGDIFLFTDDDVRPPQDWIAGMCQPLLTGKAQAVAGGVALAPHLLRDWMQPLHRCFLASTELANPTQPEFMVGANMAFLRDVLQKVPAFDLELGPGALGFADDFLFSLQLREAGYTLVSAFDVVMEHHPATSRMSRRYWKQLAAKQGCARAYVDYHWEHTYNGHSTRRLISQCIKQAIKSYVKKESLSKEGMILGEIMTRINVSYYHHYKIECKRPRNYGLRGLVKLK